MKKLKLIMIIVAFLTSSILIGIGFAHFTAGKLPERSSIGQSKSFEANQNLIWATLLDIESYPLWKPKLKSVEIPPKIKGLKLFILSALSFIIRGK